MTSKQRMLAAINRQKPDRLPVTTHHIMPSFLNQYLNGMSEFEFFEYFGLDPILWLVPHKPGNPAKEYFDPSHTDVGELMSRRVSSDEWRISTEQISGKNYPTVKYTISTPSGNLTTVLQSNEYTSWVTEHLIKNKSDIDIIAKHMVAPVCDVDKVNAEAEKFGERGLVRGNICTFDIFGQPGCWQDACCIVGTERLIMETFDDPEWVHSLLKILQKRKLTFAHSLKGAKYDILEFGGGDASTTVISPTIFNEFVAPYDSEVIEAIHNAGQKVVYHTCGGMMPILEDIAAMKPDAMETFTPIGMHGDVNLKEAKRRIGDKVCMIGGFDQLHHFVDCSESETRRAVRDCFEAAGEGGGFILAPSDHFFKADINLLKAFADEARQCVYE